MNPHDRHNAAQLNKNNADSDSASKTPIEFSNQAEKIIATIMKHKRLKDLMERFSGHHSVSSLDIYFDAAIRDEK
ncbi:hypothetical protein [Pseudomonas sp. G2-4]|uniref:hypothetical protein n=1 Tax=Pseudomonas sp. G2-4 TaxID=1506334 RepID=UPI0024B93C9E|nr:hypothetical protein [Pseudomonas sp. G2-4]WHS59821.1 hypothetical protein QNH97_25935 [Pseudomonas sp. G2-4]